MVQTLDSDVDESFDSEYDPAYIPHINDSSSKMSTGGGGGFSENESGCVLVDFLHHILSCVLSKVL